MQKKFKIIEFHAHQSVHGASFQYGQYLGEQEYPLGNTNGLKRHVLKGPLRINLGRQFIVENVDPQKMHEFPLAKNFLARVYWDVASDFNKDKIIINTLRQENKMLIAELAELKAQMTSITNKDMFHKRRLEETKESKEIQNLMFPPKIGGEE